MKDERRGALDNEITIRVSPRKIFRGAVFLLLLLAVFYVGRWSVDPPSLSGLAVGLSNLTADAPESKNETAVATAPAAPAQEALPAPAEQPAAEVAAESADTGVAGAAVADESVITTYTRSVLAIDSVKKTWMETWGKITDIGYSLKNNEAGTIKVSYLLMTVEGYDDFEKKITLPLSQQTIAAGATGSAMVKVPNGFAYNELSAGDLTSVQITLTAFDAADKAVANTSNSFDLKG